jgi:hypothetical protein
MVGACSLLGASGLGGVALAAGDAREQVGQALGNGSHVVAVCAGSRERASAPVFALGLLVVAELPVHVAGVHARPDVARNARTLASTRARAFVRAAGLSKDDRSVAGVHGAMLRIEFCEGIGDLDRVVDEPASREVPGQL